MYKKYFYIFLNIIIIKDILHKNVKFILYKNVMRLLPLMSLN